MSEPKVKTVEVYRDKAGGWRWKAKAGNGRVVADGGEGYENRNDCLDSAGALFPAAVYRIEGKPGEHRPTAALQEQTS